jgi:high-affinity iron transporter
MTSTREADKFRILNSFLFIITLLGMTLVTAGSIQAKTDYKGMVDKIGVFLNESLTSYKEGDKEEAKSKAQTAYFEIFENLEGPIRINISARKNYELEEEFGAIRKMILEGEPVDDVEKRINDLMAELRVVATELEGGFELVAEPTGEIERPATQEPGAVEQQTEENIEPVWLRVLENIESKLGQALEAYKKKDTKNAKDLVIEAQFDGYKNSLLETAIRRYVSQKKDYENNSGFTDLIGIIDNGETVEKLENHISNLIKGLKEDLPGLPIIEGVVSRRVDEREVSDEDWSQVTASLFTEIEKAIALYGKGKKEDAVGLVQDTYFDVFEGSGMEKRIGARDASLKVKLESHFSMMVGQMKKGVAVGDIQKTLTVMKTDFEKAVGTLDKGVDPPMTLFFYSLMIILREGFEAILIITAIIAYLIKTGNRDKLGVIYNGSISALILSLITAFLVKWVFNVSAASQEMMEGATMLLATVVLFSVSYWLISKAESQKWMTYIKGKVSRSLSSGSLKALWFAAFLAVYREGTETVLFYQALASNTTSLGITAILGAFGVGCALLVAIYLVVRYGAVRLPIRPFFIVTGAFLYYMAFVFAGNGMMEFIEAKLFEPSLVSWVPTIPFMGVYPYWQTLIPQVALILAAIIGITMMTIWKRASHREKS